MIRHRDLIVVVGTFLIGCAVVLMIGCTGVGSEVPEETQGHTEATKKEQARSPEATTSEEDLGVIRERRPARSESAVVVGAGDIASGLNQNDEATAKLLDGISGTVFTAGDNAYGDGTLAEFNNYYEPTWGRHKARTKPTPGNHDHHTEGAAGYFDYFGEAAGPPSRGYYSYDKGNWHVIAVDSNCEEVGGCGATSPMVSWLERDLAAHRSRCTLAYFHHPLFSSGKHGNQPQVRPIWDALYAADAEVVVSGHDHTYERFAPQRPDGTRDRERGIREFVVGTGGASLYPFGAIEANSQVRNNSTYGVLKLTLNAQSYDWKFVPVADQTFTDSGTTSCH